MKKIIFILIVLLTIVFLYNSYTNKKTNISTYYHNNNCFTQGIEKYNNFIYESCGKFGKSYIAKYKLGSKKYTKKAMLNKNYFAEGLTIFNNQIVLLTWKSGVIEIRDVENLNLKKTIKMPDIKEGWGISSNSENLFISNGSNNIYVLNKDFSIVKTISLDKRYSYINELEYYDGRIYFNIWHENNIYKLDIDSLKVKKLLTVNVSENKDYLSHKENVLNGIFIDKSSKFLYFTGKKWSKIFKVTLLQ